MNEPTTLLRVSDRARARLLDLSSGRALRLYAEKSPSGTLELGLSFDGRRDDDEELMGSDPPFVADRASLAILAASGAAAGIFLDFEETAGSRGFVLAREPTCAPRDFAE